MLNNRFMRFLTTILMLIAVVVPMSVLEILSTNNDWNWNVPDMLLFVLPIVPFIVCIVGQLFGDIMNVDTWLNNGFVTFIKRAAFFIVVLGALVIGAGLTMSLADLDELMDMKASPFVIGLCMAGTYAPAIAFLSYVFLYIRDGDNKRIMPFFFPISYLGSIALGFILALVFHFANIDYDTAIIILFALDLLMVAVGVIACFKTATWPFEEGGYYYSSSSSGSSSGYSGGYDDYSSSTSSGSSTPQPKPTPCKRCAHASNTNPETGLFTGLDMVYCTVECKLKGYWDTREGTDCPYFRKG